MQQQVNTILEAINSGRHAEALKLSRELAQSFPRDEGVRSLQAVSEQNGGDLAVAKTLLIDLTAEHPDRWQHWNNLGNVQRLLGELGSAGESYAHALQLNPQSPRLLANLGLLKLNLGDFSAAREHLCTACALPGAEHGMRVWAAVACQASADDDTASMLIQDWKSWSPISEEAKLELGWLLIQLGDTDGGHAMLAGEFQDANLRTRALARRVLALERVNRVSEARELLSRMRNPTQITDRQARMETLQAMAIIATRSKEHAAAREFYSEALSLDLPLRYQRSLNFGLARACDQLDDSTAAMEALSNAHRALDVPETARTQRSDTGLLTLLDAQKAFSGSITTASENASEKTSSPIFLVGFPRSGTTLLEQMLAAHAALVSSDEQPMVQRMLADLAQRGTAYPQALGSLVEADRERLREIYFKELAQTVTLGASQRLVDKQPLNFLALPLIRFVFPDAPIIFCQRHPCDSLLSSYMQNFRDPTLAKVCSSLQGIADLYVRLTERWISDSAKFPSSILYCRYEDLIADADRQFRRIGDFLGLDDVSAMHDFDKAAAARGFIGTPSYSQVVEGLNTDAQGRWKRYSEYIDPLLPTLKPVLEHWGYDA